MTQNTDELAKVTRKAFFALAMLPAIAGQIAASALVEYAQERDRASKKEGGK